MNEYEEILNAINEVQKSLQELFFSGFNAPNDFNLSELSRLALFLESCGMKYGYEKLKNICSELQKKRHTLEFDYRHLTDEYCKLNEYCKLCIKKLELYYAL